MQIPCIRPKHPYYDWYAHARSSCSNLISNPHTELKKRVLHINFKINANFYNNRNMHN